MSKLLSTEELTAPLAVRINNSPRIIKGQAAGVVRLIMSYPVVSRELLTEALWPGERLTAELANRQNQLIYKIRDRLPGLLVPQRQGKTFQGWSQAQGYNIKLSEYADVHVPLHEGKPIAPRVRIKPKERLLLMRCRNKSHELYNLEADLMRLMLRYPEPTALSVIAERCGATVRDVRRALTSLSARLGEDEFYFCGRGRGWRLTRPRHFNVLYDSLVEGA